MTVEQHNEETIFKTAIKLQAPVERAAYVRQACGSDAALFARVETLLQAYDSAGDFLEIPPFAPEGASVPYPLEGPGTIIGRYKLLEKIGEGGMAVVYMAEQTEPLRRKVALKIIKLGMDTRQVIARFEAERQALAMMDHPCIAKVLDAGSTETGRPYFVMELVQGVSITEYCDRNSLSTKDRLALFVQVCHAVQHAHQKGIIHRDIKPSNVMVTHHDGKPVPKVIDFGIAKAINQKLTEKTLFTRYAHLIGTPAYMSPEQAELSDLDFDTRSDIYSLGVLLYELLTGTTPFSEEELRQAGYLGMQRVIREQEPVKPSTRIRMATRERQSVGAGPRACPMPGGHGGPPLREIQGDLDWIVMKSLEKDRTHRYETASALALDVQRHLASEPVLARAPGTVYRTRKFFRRHRSQVLTISVMVVIVLAAAVLLLQWNRDRRRLAETQGLQDAAILSQARERHARGDRAGALTLAQAILLSRHVGPDAQLLYASILVEGRQVDEATAMLEGLIDQRPAIAGAAHALLARLLWESQSPNAEKAREIEEHRQKAKALLPKTADAEAYFLQAMGAITVKEQLALLDKALQLDLGHYESRRLRAFTYYASRKYEKMKDDALAMTILRQQDPLGYSLQAIACRELGRYGEAMADFDRAIGLTREDNAARLDLSAQRCEVFLRTGDYQRVVDEAQAGLKLWPGHAVFQSYMFCALTTLGEYDEARTVYHEIVNAGPEAINRFNDGCARFVFDSLHARHPWHPADREPQGPAFLSMMEAQEIYRSASVKARRLVSASGFSAHWSPDGKKLAFSIGFIGYSGVAIYDPATRETELLIVPGKDPRWSPDGKHIAFVRDCRHLRVPEFVAAEDRNRHRPTIDEEVWVMNADGTEPKRLAQGSWPSWSPDSGHVYYFSRERGRVLCSLSLDDPGAEPKRIWTGRNATPAVSPDDRKVAYLENGVLKVLDRDSQSMLAQWRVTPSAWGGMVWSPDSNEICMGACDSLDTRTGLWIYRLDGSESGKTLDGAIGMGSWAPGRTNMVFCLGVGDGGEVWIADLNPDTPTLETLGPARSLEEHFRETVATWTRRIEANPRDPNAFWRRAGYNSLLHERIQADADMRQWSAIMSARLPSGSSSAASPSLTLVGDGPSGHRVVFSESFNLGKAINLGPLVNSPAREQMPCISPDGLELYFSSHRPGGYGGYDIWVAKRASVQDSWGPPFNPGPPLNTQSYEAVASISEDGLTLYGEYAPGEHGGQDLFSSTRVAKDAPWGARVDLGSVVNSSSMDSEPVISSDGCELYFTSSRPDGSGGLDIWVSRRTAPGAPWGKPENLGPGVNTPSQDWCGWMSPDGLTILIASNRPGGPAETQAWMPTWDNLDVWKTTRPSKDGSWGTPTNLGPSVNTAYTEFLTGISPDGRWCYFESNRPGGYERGDIWQAQIVPVLEVNDERMVTGKEQQ